MLDNYYYFVKVWNIFKNLKFVFIKQIKIFVCKDIKKLCVCVLSLIIIILYNSSMKSISHCAKSKIKK